MRKFSWVDRVDAHFDFGRVAAELGLISG